MSVTAQDYAKLSLEAYGGTKTEGWSIIGWPTDEMQASGFYALAYRNGNEVVIAFRGTEGLSDVGDLAADWAITWDGEHRQFIDALEFARNVRDSLRGHPGINITVTGHSLGGALAQLAADVFGWGGMTFDAPGVADLRSNGQFQEYFAQNPGLGFHNAGALTHYTVEGSVISSISGHIGAGPTAIDTGAGLGIFGMMTTARMPAHAAIVMNLVAGGYNQLEKHSIANIYEYLQAQSDAGTVLQAYVGTFLENGVIGYSSNSIFDMISDVVDMLQGKEKLTQAQAEDLIGVLEELKSSPLFNDEAHRSALDDLVKAQDMLKVATQDIQSVTLTNAHWSESPSENRLTIRVTLEHTTLQSGQSVRVYLPNVNMGTGMPEGYGIADGLIPYRPMTGDLESSTVEYFVLNVPPGSSYAEFTLIALPDGDNNENRLDWGQVRVTLPDRAVGPTTSMTQPLSIFEQPTTQSSNYNSVVGSNYDDVDGDDDGDHDTLRGTEGDDFMDGLGGDDVIYGKGGNNIIYGGAGNDAMHTEDGNDVVNAGDGDDFAGTGAGNDLIEGGTGTDRLAGLDGNDVIYADVKLDIGVVMSQTVRGPDRDWLAGGNGDDVLVGSNGDNGLSGGAGNDLIIGGAGDDNIFGDKDWLAADIAWSYIISNGWRIYSPVGEGTAPGNGADVIYAGSGNDYVWGGRAMIPLTVEKVMIVWRAWKGMIRFVVVWVTTI